MAAHRFAAGLSAFAVLLCVSAYAASFFNPPVDSLFIWGIPFFAGLFTNILAAYFIELPNLNRGRLTREQFMRNMPRWVVAFEIAFLAVMLAHFLWMVKLSGGGVAAIVDGQYVIKTRGRILEAISESQYLQLKSLELKLFALFYLAGYFIFAMYWWFYKPQKVFQVANSPN
jgi:hypothetical protein